MNKLLDTDSYKASHYKQYPVGMNFMSSYLSARSPLMMKNEDLREKEAVSTRITFFGLQGLLKEHFSRPITEADVEEAEDYFALHGEPFNKEGFLYIVKEHGGYYPILIKAVQEGLRIPYGNALMTVESTDPKVPWIVNYAETELVRLWYPCTVASLSAAIKENIFRALVKSSDDPIGQLPFKLHDFGSRGVSSRETAMIGGMGHLTNFKGTDTVAALYGARKYYHEKMAGFSIPAAEHSTISSWGRDGEVDAYDNILKQFAKPGAVVAVVSDTYDIYNASENIWGELLRQKVIDSEALVVIRPDSGEPIKMVGDLLQILDRKFGSTTNSKGYKVLNNVRIIQGDGVNYFSINSIIHRVLELGFSMDNVAFGMGGALLQKLNRDSASFAFKTSLVRIGNVWREVSKSPVGDVSKKSLGGRLAVIRVGLQYETKIYDPEADFYTGDILENVWRNGKLLRDMTFNEVRANAALDLGI